MFALSALVLIVHFWLCVSVLTSGFLSLCNSFGFRCGNSIYFNIALQLLCVQLFCYDSALVFKCKTFIPLNAAIQIMVYILSGILKDTKLVQPLGGAQYPDLLK